MTRPSAEPSRADRIAVLFRDLNPVLLARLSRGGVRDSRVNREDAAAAALEALLRARDLDIGSPKRVLAWLTTTAHRVQLRTLTSRTVPIETIGELQDPTVIGDVVERRESLTLDRARQLGAPRAAARCFGYEPAATAALTGLPTRLARRDLRNARRQLARRRVGA